MEAPEQAADAPVAPVAEVADTSVVAEEPARPRRRRGRTALLIAGAAVLGVVAGTCTGYLIQADREPTKLPSLSQPTLVQARGPAPEPLSAAQDRQVKADGDLRKLLIKRPGGTKRTDLPGLATQSDGRWDYPAIVKPPLPSGSPGPFDTGNTTGAHYADLRALLLPAPKGAVDDRKLHGADGWLATKDFLSEYAQKESRDMLRESLVDDGLRHIAARGWTTADGTRTRVYLLQFGTAAVVDALFSSEAPSGGPADQLRGTITSEFDKNYPSRAHDENVPYSAYVETTPYGAEQTRQAYLSAGDVLAVIVQSRKGTAKPVPFRQTVALQSQLLG